MAGQRNFSYMLAAAVVRADIYKFGFYLLSSTLYFQLGICTGQTSIEFPAFANTQRCASPKTGISFQNSNIKEY